MNGNGTLSLVVFDLDFTLWDCGGLWVDCTSLPFRVDDDNSVRDSANRLLRLYPEVPEILETVESLECKMAIASRTDQPTWARELLELMGHWSRFDSAEIFPSSKVAHFSNLHRDLGIPFEEMLFFDDEERNIIEVGALGVKCIHVARGIDRGIFEKGLDLF